MEYTITWNSLPGTLEEMQALPEASLAKPEYTAALTVAALCVYPENKEECFRMLDWLKGPADLSTYEKQFLRDRFMDGKGYIPRSYFKGAVPENDYKPSEPYTILVSDSHAEVADEGYRKMDLKSGGADSARPVMLRLKPSTGQWFLVEQMLLAGIRVPKSADPWA